MCVWIRSVIAAGFTFITVTIGLTAPAFAGCGSPPGSRPGYWCYVDGPHVRVWWSRPSLAGPASGDETTARLVRDEVEGSLWSRYQTLLGRVPLSDADSRLYVSNGGDGHYDIMLVNDAFGQNGLSPVVPLLPGRTVPRARARYSLVKAVLPKTELLGVTAHELMHGFLSAFECRSQCEWLHEATATWAEHFAYPRANTEHQYAGSFFANPRRPLDDRPTVKDPHQFGAYLFLFFLQHRGPSGSNNAGLVRSIWEASEWSSDSLSAIEDAVPGGFTGVWREFITDNWNAPPAVAQSRTGPAPIYSVWDGLTTGVQAQSGFLKFTLQAGNTQQLTMSLPHLSASYYVFDFAATDIRFVQVVHNIADLRARGVEGAEIVIFTRVPGQGWREATYDATQNVRSFCRDKADENVQEMVVIFGNSDPRSLPIDFVADDGTKPAVTASNAGCLTGGSGFQQCRVEIRSQPGARDVYHDVEIQTWEISGPPTPGRTPNEYPYLWTVELSGSAMKTNVPEWWAWWRRTGTGDGAFEVFLEQTTSGWQRAMRPTDSAAPLSGNEVIGYQASLTSAPPDPIKQPWNEMNVLRHVGSLAAPRIEATSANTINFASPPPGIVLPAMPGVGQPRDPIITTSCRWSFPGM